MRWFECGAHAKDWPPFQKADDFNALVVVDILGRVGHYEHLPLLLRCHDAAYACGAGDVAAMAAMRAGADAIKAVQICNELVPGCGRGVDWMRLDGSEGTCP